MQRLLYDYHLDPTTWVYLSSLLAITLFFKFGQLFRFRNLDLLGIVALAPGLVLTQSVGGRSIGYMWLFGWGLLWTTRLLLDSLMVRRPLLEPNLNLGGMSFLGFALVFFLTMHALTRPAARDYVWPREPDPDARFAPGEPARLLLPICGNPILKLCEAPVVPGPAPAPIAVEASSLLAAPPRDGSPAPSTDVAARLLTDLPTAAAGSSTSGKVWSAGPLGGDDLAQGGRVLAAHSAAASIGPPPHPFLQGNWIGRLFGIAAHFSVAAALITLGAAHFKNAATGISVAVLFLLLPSTALMIDRIDHALPAMFVLWALVGYRYPILAGIWLGMGAGLTFYPVFLIPLWTGFYWNRGLRRFWIATAGSAVGVLLVTGLVCGFDEVALSALKTFGWLGPDAAVWNGLWGPLFLPAYRLPVQVAFWALCGSFALWPVSKNLGTMLSCSAAVMLMTQFWHPVGGGAYFTWYVPLLLATVFRPNLQDRQVIAFVMEPRSSAPPSSAGLRAA